MDDTNAAICRLRRYSSAMDDLTRYVAAAAPGRTAATDPTGSITVHLDPDGQPVSFHVGAGWRRAIGADGFAAAVTQACRAAVEAHRKAWTQGLDQRDLSTALDSLSRRVTDDHADGRDDSPDLTRAIAWSAADPAGVRARALDVVSGELLSALERATTDRDRAERTAAQAHSGDADSPSVHRIDLTRSVTGDISCLADPDWVSRREAGELTLALNAALARLATIPPDRDASMAAHDTMAAYDTMAAHDAHLDSLFAESLAILRDL